MKTKLNVLKIGGEIINDAPKLSDFLRYFSQLNGAKILVHGGGKMATEISQQLGIATQMNEGRRITSSENLDVVTMVYAGLINKKIVAQLQSEKCNALGLSGADANSIEASKRGIKPIDYGYVGDVKTVNSSLIDGFLHQNITPVFSAICHDGKGQLLNTNADTIAAEIAIALCKIYDTTLTYCFEKQGVLMDINDDQSIIKNIDPVNYETLKAKKLIHDGMLPKLENAFYALDNHVARVMIGNTSITNGINKHTKLKIT